MLEKLNRRQRDTLIFLTAYKGPSEIYTLEKAVQYLGFENEFWPIYNGLHSLGLLALCGSENKLTPAAYSIGEELLEKESNYRQNQPQHQQKKQEKWAGRKPNVVQILQIIYDHNKWLNCKYVETNEPPHDLSEANLERSNFYNANLMGIKMEKANLQHALLSRAIFRSANLSRANMRRSQMVRTRFVETKLCEASMIGANISCAVFQDSDLSGTDMTAVKAIPDDSSGWIGVFDVASFRNIIAPGAIFNSAKLPMAYFYRAELARAKFVNADLKEADLRFSNIRGANMRYITISGAKTTGIKYDRKTIFHSCRSDGMAGSVKFKDFVMTQQYNEELKQTKMGAMIYWIWWALADCGLSFRRLLGCLFASIVFFSVVYYVWIPPGQLGWNNINNLTYLSALKTSAFAIFSLGFGGVDSLVGFGAAVVFAEILWGYVLLGALISVFSARLVHKG